MTCECSNVRRQPSHGFITADDQLRTDTWSYDDYRLLWPHRPRIHESETGRDMPANERGKDTYYISEVIYDETVEPGKAILRHTDRWRRHVDVIWEEEVAGPADQAGEAGAVVGETTWRMKRVVRRRDLDGARS